MRTRTLLALLLLACPASAARPGAKAREAPQDSSGLLSSGCDKFFGGDLAGAADDWAAAQAAGGKSAGELAVLALTVLSKEALRAGDLLIAAVHATHGLELSPKDPTLNALFKRAEDDQRFQRRAPGRGSRAPSSDGLDSSAEQEKLIARVLRIDVSSPRLSPGPSGGPEPGGSQELLRQVFAEDKDFRLDRMLQSVQRDEDALRAADRARLSRAWRRRRAKYSYQQGLPAYYAGDFETAARWFRQAAQLDPSLKEAKAGLKGCEAALARPRD